MLLYLSKVWTIFSFKITGKVTRGANMCIDCGKVGIKPLDRSLKAELRCQVCWGVVLESTKCRLEELQDKEKSAVTKCDECSCPLVRMAEREGEDGRRDVKDALT